MSAWRKASLLALTVLCALVWSQVCARNASGSELAVIEPGFMNVDVEYRPGEFGELENFTVFGMTRYNDYSNSFVQFTYFPDQPVQTYYQIGGSVYSESSLPINRAFMKNGTKLDFERVSGRITEYKGEMLYRQVFLITFTREFLLQFTDIDLIFKVMGGGDFLFKISHLDIKNCLTVMERIHKNPSKYK